ncbi:MAG: hypothetical protein ACK5CY_00885 [Bacteroidia bacterium]|jgi:hypothetical protein
MKSHIEYPHVEDISVAIVEEGIGEEKAWAVYLLNQKEQAISDVLISSRGYGKINDEDVHTSVLRHFFEKIEPNSYVRIEPIMEEMFALSNEYWVSFYQRGVIHDKKFIFLPETVSASFFSKIPLLNKKGVIIS